MGAPRPPHAGDLWLLYHGSIVPSRLPPSVIRALARLPGTVKLRIVGYETIGHPGYVAHLRALAGDYGLLDRVEYVGAVPTRTDLMRLCDESDVGLTLLIPTAHDSNEQDMVGASNKPFDYLARGLPLLVPDQPDWRGMYVDPGYGLACDPADPASIATAIQRFLEDPARMRVMGERGRRGILSEWSYESQFTPVQQELAMGGDTEPRPSWDQPLARSPRMTDQCLHGESGRTRGAPSD